MLSHSDHEEGHSSLKDSLQTLWFFCRQFKARILIASTTIALTYVGGLVVVNLSNIHMFNFNFKNAGPSSFGEYVDINSPAIQNVPKLGECLRDWTDRGNGMSGMDLPPIVPAGLQLPFYVLPEDLPKEMAWSQCFLETGKPMFNKRQWSYFIAKQLENHPWRVYEPDKALLFVLPWFDSGDLGNDEDIPKDCLNLLKALTVEDWPALFDKLAKDHPYLHARNTILMLGDYFLRDIFDKHRREEDASQLPWWSESTFQPNFASFVARGVRNPYQQNMVNSVDEALCYPGEALSTIPFESKKQRLEHCDKLHARLESDAQLEYADWIEQRPIRYECMGRLDSRKAYLTRKVVTYSLQSLFDAGTLPDVLNPSMILFKDHAHEDRGRINKNSGTHSDEGRAAVCKHALMPLIDHHDVRIKNSIICGGSLPPEWHEYIQDFPEMDWEIKSNSQMTLSMRGDCLGSQRSFEGLLYGTLTYHDTPAYLMGMSTLPLPDHLPWRLTGVFDENQCIRNSRRTWETSVGKKKRWISHGELKTEPENDPGIHFPNPEEMIDTIADRIAECIVNLPMLIDEEPEVTDLMRRVIQYYRDDVIPELPGSRVGQNLIFEAASLMDVADLERFGLSREDFTASVPSSCTSESAEMLAHTRSLDTEEKRFAYLFTLGEVDNLLCAGSMRF